MENSYYYLNILINGVIFSVFASLFERILIISGLTRGNTIWLIVGCFAIAILKQVFASPNSIWLFLFVTILGPISINRIDIINSFNKGRWWWKKMGN